MLMLWRRQTASIFSLYWTLVRRQACVWSFPHDISNGSSQKLNHHNFRICCSTVDLWTSMHFFQMRFCALLLPLALPQVLFAPLSTLLFSPPVIGQIISSIHSVPQHKWNWTAYLVQSVDPDYGQCSHTHSMNHKVWKFGIKKVNLKATLDYVHTAGLNAHLRFFAAIRIFFCVVVLVII